MKQPSLFFYKDIFDFFEVRPVIGVFVNLNSRGTLNRKLTEGGRRMRNLFPKIYFFQDRPVIGVFVNLNSRGMLNGKQ